MSNTILVSAALILVSAVAIGVLASVCAKRRSAALYVAGVALVWIGASIALGYYDSISDLLPDRISLTRRIVTNFLSIAPLALVPAAFAAPPVFGRAERKWIPLLAIAGAVVAFPITIGTGLAATCYVGWDCP